jgi:hypothetical protein
MGELTQDDVETMTVPPWEQAKAAIAAGDLEWAIDRVDESVARWRSLQDYSINWITSLLSFIGREMGEEAVERALRITGEEFLRPRRDTGGDWNALPAEARAKAVARAMVANFGACDVEEDDEKITLSFRCGSGGRLIDEGRYEGEGGYLVLRDPSPMTFMRDELPVYCAHCSVNNEIQPVEWTGHPLTVESPPEGKGGRCVHHVYKDVEAIPEEVYRRIGKEKT